MNREERRAQVKQAWLAADGELNVSQLARQLGVHRETIARDIQHIQTELAAAPTFDSDRDESAGIFAKVRDAAMEAWQLGGKRTTDTARAAYMRVALEAEGKRAKLLGLESPQRVETEVSIITTIEVIKDYGE